MIDDEARWRKGESIAPRFEETLRRMVREEVRRAG